MEEFVGSVFDSLKVGRITKIRALQLLASVERSRRYLSAGSRLLAIPSDPAFGKAAFVGYLSGREGFLTDHVIRGNSVLPGVFYLELVRAAAESEGWWSEADRSGICLRGVVWLRPLIVSEPVEIRVELSRVDEGELEFSVSALLPGADRRDDASRWTVNSRGAISGISDGLPREVDVEALRAESSARTFAAEELYSFYEASGISYGPSHRSVQRLHVGRDGAGALQVLAELELPDGLEDEASDYVLHPSLLDGALQACVGLSLGAGEQASGRTALPFAVEQVTIFGPSPRRCLAWIRSSSTRGESALRKLDIDLLDDNGKVSVRLEGFSSRTVEEEGKAETILLCPQWLGRDPAGDSVQGHHWVFLCGWGEEASSLGAELRSVLPEVRWLAVGDGSGGIGERYERAAHEIFVELQAALHERSQTPVLAQVIVPLSAEGSVFEGLSGLLRTAGLENPRLHGQVIGIERQAATAGIAGKLIETAGSRSDHQIRYRSGERQVLDWSRHEGIGAAASPWRDEGVYLITGGAGGLGLIFAREIAARVRAPKLVLTGRSALDEEKAATIRSLEALGAGVSYHQVDVTDAAALRELIERVRGDYGGLNGILHSAGVIHDGFITKKTVAEMKAVLAPKVSGLVQLDEATAAEPLDFMVLFSSGAGVWGNVGQADYAAANGFLDSYARHRNGLVLLGQRHGRTLSVDWPLWRHGGMKIDAGLERLLRTQGIAALPTDEGIEALYRAFAAGQDQVAVLCGDVRQFERSSRSPSAKVSVSEEVTQAAAPVQNDVLRERTERYLVQLLSQSLKLPPHRIEPQAALEQYGIDSIVAMELTNTLEKVFGSLSKTLFFEYQSIAALAQYFLKEQKEKLTGLLGLESSPRPPSGESRVLEAAATAPVVKRWRRERNEPAAAIPQAGGAADIAIIGLSGRYPGARTLEEFWSNLTQGVDSITEIPPERWDFRAHFDPERGKPGKSYSKWGGFLEGVDEFDPLFFNIAPRHAEGIDPQVRLFLQTVWMLLESSSHTSHVLRSRYDGRVGVYVGSMYQQYRVTDPMDIDHDAASIVSSYSAIANRTSYFFGLEGPSVAVDTMCSSSAMAIHLACSGLRQRDCELAIAGGVNLSINPRKYVGLSHTHSIGSRPDSRSFTDGDGFLPAEAVGAVLLKPLFNAIAAKDPILAVIKGTATMHGGRGNGYLAPNLALQTKVVTEVLRQAEISPETISYIEASASGAALSDAIEISSLNKVFHDNGANGRRYVIGSVKSNIGHPEAASGIAQLSKVVLQLRHRQFVPSIKVEALNPDLRLEETPFVLQREPGRWDRPFVAGAVRGEIPRRALINSFGAGGTYVSLVVEEYVADPAQRRAAEGPPYVCVFSAKHPDRLQALAEEMLRYVEQRPELNLADFAYTLQVGREAMEVRLALVVRSRAELVENLGAYLAAARRNETLFGTSIHVSHDQGVGQISSLLSGGLGEALVDNLLASRDFEKIALFWVSGGQVPWLALYGETPPDKLELPSYPFARERYPILPGSKVADDRWSTSGAVRAVEAQSEPRGEAVRTFITRALSEALQIPVGLIKANRPMLEYGLDSVLGLRLIRQLDRKFNAVVAGRDLLDHPTINDLAAFITGRIKADAGAPLEEVLDPLTAKEAVDNDLAGSRPSLHFPLSQGQRGLWWLHKTSSGASGYHVPLCLKLLRPVDLRLLERVMSLVVASHPVLGCVVSEEDGTPYLSSRHGAGVSAVYEDISSLETAAAFSHIERLSKSPFSLEGGPLIRAHLLSRSKDEQFLLLVVHHIVFDGASVRPLLETLFKAYEAVSRGEAIGTRPADATYADFVVWEQQLLKSERGRAHLEYWRERLSGPLPVLEFPSDHPRHASSRTQGRTYSLPILDDVFAQVRAFAGAHAASPAVVFLAVYQLLLHRYTGLTDIIVGVPTVGRSEERFEKLVGYFVNVIAVRCHLGGDARFVEFLKNVQTTLVEGLDHSEYPFPTLVRDLKVSRSAEHSPIFQVAFEYQSASVVRAAEFGSEAGSPLGTLVPGLRQEGEYELVLEVSERSDGYDLHFKYDPELFDRTTIVRVADHLINLLKDVISDPRKALSDYQLLTAAERQTILLDWNATRSDRPRECIHELIVQEAQRRPAAVAVRFQQETMSYGELEEKSASLARRLARQGIGPGRLVGIYIERSIDMVVGLLGILRAGGAYVPLDPNYPASHLGHMLQDSGTQLVLTQQRLVDKLRSFLPSWARSIAIDTATERGLVSTGPEWSKDIKPDDLAYVIYTSGSTGRPKGVMVRHLGLTNILTAMKRYLGLGAEDVLLAVTTLNFDIAGLELYLPLICGAQCVIATSESVRDVEKLKSEIGRIRPTVMQATPITWSLLFRAGWRNNEGLRILCGGEALPENLKRQIVASGSAAWNLYGPTETTIWSTASKITEDPVSIGTPIANTQVYVLDRDLSPMPIMMAGELYIGGDGVAAGYHNLPDLTVERFIENPFNPASRLYKTGDLVRWRPDGQLEYLGRLDNQIKVRGYRVEPGEIEARLSEHANVSESAAVLHEQEGHGRLIAYCSGKAVAAAELREHLRARLPEYMIPSRFVMLDALPRNANGKVDRRILMQGLPDEAQEPDDPIGHAVSSVPASIENRVLSAWLEILGIERIGLEDGFFDVGGDSFLALQLSQRIANGFDCEFSVTDLFKYGTVRSISRYLSQKADTRQQANAHSLAPRASQSRSASDPATYYGNSLAIIGISCQFPGARDHYEFWDNLRDGRESIRFLTHDELRRLGLSDALIRNKDFVPACAMLDDRDLFDPGFFKISPRDAELMDPQTRLLLQHAWKAVEDAGYAASDIPSTSVFISTSNSGYGFAADRSPTDAYLSWVLAQAGTSPAIISHKLNFNGPSYSLHSNCSSSLLGLHAAHQAIAAGESEYALVGASTVFARQPSGYLYQPGLNFSSDGHVKAFDAAADGMVGGEGAAVLLLKSAAQAIADGDHIYAVIRDVGINNDGGRKAGFYAPSSRGQGEVIEKVLARAGIDPSTIGYVEAHGTGTKLGDPVEFRALRDAYGRYTDEKQFCGLGSVKSNIGHLDTVAGLAGCIKLALMFEKGEMVPTLNYTMPNPEIDLENSPFRIITAAKRWEVGEQPRRAALSSFGIGGTNTHAVLEQAVRVEISPEQQTEPSLFIVPISARNSEQLRSHAENLLRYVEAQYEAASLDLRSMTYTLQVGREAMASRVAFVADSAGTLMVQLESFLRGDETVFGCFAGQAKADPQGASLDEHDAAMLLHKWLVAGDVNKIAGAWTQGFRVDWNGLYGEVKPRRISLPTYPFARERYWVSTPERSLPGPSALVRGRLHPLVQENISDLWGQRFRTVLGDDEFFTRDHVVLGEKVLPGVAYLEMARAAVMAASGPDAEPGSAIVLRNVVWARPVRIGDGGVELQIDLDAETDGTISYEVSSRGEDAEDAVHFQGRAVLGSGAAEAVAVATLRAACGERTLAGADCYARHEASGISYGPSHRSVQRLHVGRDGAGALQVLAELELPDGLEDEASDYVLHPSLLDGALQACVGLSLGAGEQASGRTALPFAVEQVTIFGPSPRRCLAWIRSSSTRGESALRKLDIDLLDDNGKVSVSVRGLDLREASGPQIQTRVPDGPEAEGSDVLTFEEVWQEQPPAVDISRKVESLVCFVSGSGAREGFYEALKELGQTTKITFVEPGDHYEKHSDASYRIRIDDAADYERVLNDVKTTHAGVDGVLYMWSLGDPGCRIDHGPIVRLLQGLARTQLSCGRLLLWGAFESGLERCHIESWIGFERSLGLAWPRTRVSIMGQQVERRSGIERDWVARIWNELQSGRVESSFYDIGGRRQVCRIAPVRLSQGGRILQEGGSYLISGGCGGLGLLFAEHLARTCRAKLILTGRSALDEAKRTAIRKLEAYGSEVLYLQQDVCDEAGLRAGLQMAEARFGALRGVIHAAGVQAEGSVFSKELASFQSVIRPKIEGTLVLDRVLQDRALDFVCYFSSTAAVLGDFGACSYAVGNRFLMAYGRERDLTSAPGRTLVINWGLWGGRGMGFGNAEQTYMYLKSSGQRALEAEEGVKFFDDVLNSSQLQCIVLAGQPSRVRGFLKLESDTEDPSPMPVAKEERRGRRVEMRGLSIAGCVLWDLKDMVSEQLKIARDRIDVEDNLANFGFDSIGLAGFARRLTRHYHADVSPAVFFSHPTLARLSKYLVETHPAAVEALYREDTLEPVAKELESDRVVPVAKIKERRRLKFKTSLASREEVPEPIAIIGMSGRFPGAADVGAFWRNLVEGRDCISEVPGERWDWRQHYGDPNQEPNKANVKWGGFIDGVEEFDPLFFEISPREAELMDPRQRLLLMESWKALEDAGYGRAQLAGGKVGTFVGVEQGDYRFLTQGNGITGNHEGILAARLAYFLNLHGPTMAINTACSSALVALHQACLSLRNCECETALAAGVNLLLTPGGHVGMSQAGMLSSDGRCRAFDRNANGMVPGEAIAVVVLKRLSQAEADRDPIHAVIRGSGINYDGKTNGITAPSGASQSSLLKEVYDRYRVNPEEIEYIVTHGTGTKLGDPVEVNALNEAFKSYTQRQGFCALTSTKTNVGHSLAASGLVSLIGLVQALRHETIPPSLHCDEENDYINWQASPFYINKANTPWPGRDGRRRLGAVSAFGMSGTNAHVVVESYRPQEEPDPVIRAPYYLLALSAKTEAALQARIEDLIALIEKQDWPAHALSAMSQTLLCGRRHFNHRCAIVIEDRDAALHALRQTHRQEQTPSLFRGKVANGFVGQRALQSYGGDLLMRSQSQWENRAAYQETLYALAELYCQGYEFSWEQLQETAPPRRISLPTYPFAKERYWVPEAAKPA
ncbi:non-ribosomal peptide synthetase, partial [Bradyrhizobium sp. SZCCHNRI2049]|uniref:non-ribosomal peptide synthetase n=1 Tax=Bradyrhizobium sp. SZCCHNRI2049 TaxID=3057287 RepID=UPI0029168C83